MSDKIYTPFTDKEVRRLRAWQASSRVHPYTCPKRGEAKHRWSEIAGDYGALLPTPDGLVCLDCDYVQYWAFDFPPPPPSLQEVFGFE